MVARISIGFGSFPNTELDNFAQGVIDALTGVVGYRAGARIERFWVLAAKPQVVVSLRRVSGRM